MEEISLTINDKRINCPSGTTVMEAARQERIKIPNLCYHPDLEPFGACRLCLVEEEKSGRLVASCVMPVSEGMVIRTDTPTIRKHRINIVRLMMANHPESCIVCNQGNRCELRQVAAELGVGRIDLYPMPHYTGLEDANPFIVRDLSKCILCGKCIRADHELVVVGAIDYNLRGFRSRPATVHDMPLENSPCTFCGTCVSMCPTGALSTKNTRYVGTPQRQSPTICGFCGVGCSLELGSADGRIVEANPAHREGSVNGSTLCVRGHFAHDFLNAKDRLTGPMVRKDGELASVSWDEALEAVAERLADIKRKYGPQSMGFLGSSKCTNEENYLFQKIARVFFGTNNVDNGGSLSGSPLRTMMDDRAGDGYGIRPLSAIGEAGAVLVLGADPNVSLPVVSYYLKRAAREGTPVIVADPRMTDLAPFSDLWLSLRPHTDTELLNGLSYLIWKRGKHDPGFIERFTDGFGRYSDGLSSLDIERSCGITGLRLELLEKAVDMLEGGNIAFVVGNGILQQRHGLIAMEALLNLSLMTGSPGHDGGGFFLLSKENNQVGARDMGAVPQMLPGRQPIKSEDARKGWEQRWQVKLSPDRGLNMIRMIEEAEKGNLKALYVMGENPLRSLPQSQRVLEALDKLEFLVVQDILESETSQIADIVLAGAAFSEKEGSFTNMEGRIQSFKPAVPPPGDARADWEILDILAINLGQAKLYGSVEKISAEIANTIPMYAGLGGGTEGARVRQSSEGKPIHFSAVFSLEDEAADDEFPLTAILGSQRFHLGSGTRTSRSDSINRFDLKGELEVSPEDAANLGLQGGDMVRIRSAHGAVVREIRLEKRLKAGLVFLPTAFNGNDAGNLVELKLPGEPDFSGWKTCAVRLEKV